MEAAPNADLRGVGLITDFCCGLVQSRTTQPLLFIDDLSWPAYRCLLSCLSHIGHQLSKMWFSLASDSLSKAGRYLVSLDDGASHMSRLWIP
jgi:hypothetical protein